MLGRPQGTHCKSGCGLTPWYLKHENYYYYYYRWIMNEKSSCFQSSNEEQSLPFSSLLLVAKFLTSCRRATWFFISQRCPSNHMLTILYNYFPGVAWWLTGRFVDFRPKDRKFESRSNRHVGTLGKSFTRSCLWCFDVKLRHSIHAVSGAPLSSGGLEEWRGAIEIALMNELYLCQWVHYADA